MEELYKTINGSTKGIEYQIADIEEIADAMSVLGMDSSTLTIAVEEIQHELEAIREALRKYTQSEFDASMTQIGKTLSALTK
jgi:hypothetical protein